MLLLLLLSGDGSLLLGSGGLLLLGGSDLLLLSLLLLGEGGGVLLVLVDGPIEDVVVLEGLSDEEVAEDLAEVGVVWLVVESEGASVVEVNAELVGETAA